MTGMSRASSADGVATPAWVGGATEGVSKAGEGSGLSEGRAAGDRAFSGVGERPTCVPPVARFDEEVRDLLKRALEASGGKIYGPDGAAALLGLRPTTLQGKLRKLGINRPLAPGRSSS